MHAVWKSRGLASTMHRLFYCNIVHLLVVYLATCDAARILGIVPLEAPSHNILLSSLFKELVKRGHHMTVITAVPLKDVPQNYTQIKTDVNLDALLGGPTNIFDMGDMNPLHLSMLMWSVGNILSDLTLKSPDVQKLIHSSNNQFDLLVAENFYDEALLGFSYKFNIPFVGVTTFSGTESLKGIVGDPFPYSYVPSPFISYSDHMTFFQRLHNTVINFLTKLGHVFYFIPSQDAIMRKYFSEVPNLPPLSDIIYNASLLLLNTHFSHDFPRPKVPNLIEVGGMHIKPPKKLPQDIQKFFDDAKDGAIYFSMGSNLKSSEMSDSKRTAFLNAFAKLKQRVLWKFEENLPGVPDNVKISKWFPQSDVLGHPNLRLFVTHGGLLSSQEAIYNAIPLVGIPIFADQKLNVFRAVDAGYALQLDYENITETSVYWTLNEIINNLKYKLAAERASRIFHDQPETPMERAVFWVEYVLRHKGARHLRNAGLDLAWYQYYLVDVIAVLLASSVAAVVFLVWMLRALSRLVLKKPQKKTVHDSKKRK